MADNSAAALIERFRKGKPTSREEREKQKQGSGASKMWYEANPGGDDQEMPRSLNVGPTRQPTRPNSALRGIRQPADYMSPVASNSLFQNTRLGESQNVDDMIQNEIRQLERDMYEQDRKTNARMNLGSFEPTRSIDLQRSYDDSPNFRFGSIRDSREFDRSRTASPSNLRRSQQNTNRLSDSTGDFLRKYDIGNFEGAGLGGATTGRSYRGGNISPLRLSGAGDILRSSVETLGSTGFMGLMKANLKLDGKKEEEKPKEEKSDAQIAEINKNLEAFLASMNENHPARNPYFPEGVEETIAQVTNTLNNHMMGFKTLFGDKQLLEDEETKALKERDEKLREEGRVQIREKQLLELDLPASHPLEYFGVWDGQQQQPTMQHQGPLDYFPYPVPAQLPPAGYSAAVAGPPMAAPRMPGNGPDDLAHLRLSDNSLGSPLGSPFPHYDSTILSPEPSAPGGRTNTGDPLPMEAFPVGNPTPPAGDKAPTAEQKETGEAGAPVPAPTATPTLLNAGLLSAGNQAAQLPSMSRPVATGAYVGPQAGMYPAGRNFAQNMGMVQAAVDVEMNAADEVVSKMRALRMGVGQRMRQLDALHGSFNGPITDYRQQAAGMPLYARPGGPPPAPSYNNPAMTATSSRMQQQGRYPAGLGPIYNAPSTSSPYPYQAVPPHLQHRIPQQYWGHEDQYAAAERERVMATEDTRVMFNPYPELVHNNIYGVAKGIGSVLDVAMNSLNTRLPAQEVKKEHPAPTVSPTLAQATAAAAEKVAITTADTKATVAVPAVAAPSAPAAAPPAVAATSPPPAVTPAKASPVLSPEASAAKVASASLVSDVLKEALAHPHTTAAPAPKVPAPAPPLPAKSAQQVLAEMDAVLGVDDRRSNYLARDLVLPTPSTNTFPETHAPSVPSTSRPFLQAADAYLQSHYAPNMYDPRLQYDAARRGQGGRQASPVVIRAPTDRELQMQYNQQVASRFDFDPLSASASAPPAALEFAIGLSPSPQRSVQSQMYPRSPGNNGIVGDAAAFPTDPRRMVAQANMLPMRRPTEGAALEYMRSNRIGVVNTDTGRKYVSPFPPSQSPVSAPPSQNPFYRDPHEQKPLSNLSHVDYNATVNNPFLPRRHASPAASRVHFEANMNAVNVQIPSPTSVAMHDRELYLNKMRQLRQNLQATV